MLTTVKAPEAFKELFEVANQFVSKYFAEKKEDPTTGTIEIFGERYVLVRAASMSVDFFDTVKNLYQDQGEEQALNVANNLLYDIAHSIGKADAKAFHRKIDLKEPIEKLSAGPIHFSHTGWAFVDIFPESNPAPNEDFFLIYDHPFSFESDAWLRSHKDSSRPVCIMNAGYSSGWCEESFDISLVATEITCRARGDKACRFIMAHPSRIESFIKRYMNQQPGLRGSTSTYEIPRFFKRKQLEEDLRASNEELERSNQDLQQFAYVVSHDLQEPLRVVTGFLKLLERRYKGRLDTDADEFISFAREGVDRMQTMINDLLAYSRVTTHAKEPQAVDITDALEGALKNLKAAITESSARIHHDAPLPQVLVDTSLATQLLQNLIANAIKFRGEDPPQITISALREGEMWRFSVQDNGIGVDSRFTDKIFEVFRRLHTRDQYPGSGIGLSICKRIVEHYGGRIWVESDNGQGARFSFTLPAVG